MTPLTSIVILTRNELEYTRRCLDSIAKWTEEPYELVLVDNGSTDGTVDYLRSIAGAVVIDNGENLGFAGGCNQGIAASSGDRILLLNNDTMATPGWLAAMHRALDRSDDMGIVGPRSNNVAGDQLVETVEYDVETAEGLERFARSWSAQHEGQGREFPRLIGFCMLVRRQVVERIGGFDLRFGIGNFEDDDFCLRACVAGFRNWICDEAFVHHFGSRTFAGEQVDYSAFLESGWKHFEHKWRPTAVTAEGGAVVGYDPTDVLRRSTFDPAVHYEPLVAQRDDEAIARFEHRGIAVLVAADRLRPQETRQALDGTLRAFGPEDDITVVVRIDEADEATLPQLEHIADALGEQLPDVVVIAASDRNDEAVVRASDVVVTHGVAGRALEGLARWTGTRTSSLDQLSERVSPSAG